MENRQETFGERIERLRARTAQAGWKGPGSVSIADSTWARALELVRVVEQETHGRVPRPFISASATGSLFLSYGQAPGRVIDVEVCADGSTHIEEDDGTKRR